MYLAKTAEGRKEQMKLIERFNKQREARELSYKKYKELINSGIPEDQIPDEIKVKSPLICY